jgi:HD-GYP domain-containing protein (c-di-GMP phosphodiesterase class II)
LYCLSRDGINGSSSIAEYILSHHEHWDGSGYPQGLAGERIPLLSRVFSIVDAFYTMTKERPYKKAVSIKDAAKEIALNSGTQFDPDIARIFIDKAIHN